MADRVWDTRDGAHRAAFMRLLAPLVIASGTRQFDDEATSRVALTTWMQALHDVPAPLIAEGVNRLLAGVTWMPKPGEVRTACAAIASERRAVAARQARTLADACDDCSEGWRENADGCVERCQCWKRGQALIAAAGAAVARPALQEAGHDEA